MQSLKAFETRGILSTQACDVRERLKTNDTGFNKSIKEIQFGETFNSQQLLFANTSTESKVSLEILSFLTNKLKTLSWVLSLPTSEITSTLVLVDFIKSSTYMFLLLRHSLLPGFAPRPSRQFSSNTN